mmetsp:Transcript_18674/g.44976  ORF Transcript_18674/g.44976 Transcript_18674/m.44976 type:complete len:223 (-) Transcript_18674:47-715(-)
MNFAEMNCVFQVLRHSAQLVSLAHQLLVGDGNMMIVDAAPTHQHPLWGFKLVAWRLHQRASGVVPPGDQSVGMCGDPRIARRSVKTSPLSSFQVSFGLRSGKTLVRQFHRGQRLRAIDCLPAVRCGRRCHVTVIPVTRRHSCCGGVIDHHLLLTRAGERRPKPKSLLLLVRLVDQVVVAIAHGIDRSGAIHGGAFAIVGQIQLIRIGRGVPSSRKDHSHDCT